MYTHLVMSAFFAAVCGVTSRGDTPLEGAGRRFRLEPDNVTAVIGDHVVMSCEVMRGHEANMGGQCQWTRDGFGLGQDPGLPGFPRYSMEVTETGGCHLHIFPVLVEDEAEYQCQSVSGTGSLVSRTAVVSVNARPGVPFISQARACDILDVEEDREVELECETSGAKPGAEIQWRTEDEGLVMDKMLGNLFYLVMWTRPASSPWTRQGPGAWC